MTLVSMTKVLCCVSYKKRLELNILTIRIIRIYDCGSDDQDLQVLDLHIDNRTQLDTKIQESA